MTRSIARRPPVSRTTLVVGATLAAAAATAFWVELRARRAEREHPARGKFVDVDGVRLHYVERGYGSPVVLLHGNAVSLEDFEASGLISALARDHRVIAFDRPGFGHSTRPRDRLWTPAAQAALLDRAFERVGIVRPIVVGHSMGAMVAMRVALDHPIDVQRLVLLGGYYYQSLRVDALLTAGGAVPIIGDALRYTTMAVGARLLLERSVQAMFAPKEIPRGYIATVSREMMVRPSQLRANAEDAAFMVPAAISASAQYRDLTMPVVIVAGADDEIVDTEEQSLRLHGEVAQSELVLVPRAGHMVHHAALDAVVEAIG